MRKRLWLLVVIVILSLIVPTFMPSGQAAHAASSILWSRGLTDDNAGVYTPGAALLSKSDNGVMVGNCYSTLAFIATYEAGGSLLGRLPDGTDLHPCFDPEGHASAVAADGTLYTSQWSSIPNNPGTPIVAYAPDGTQKWSFTLPHGLQQIVSLAVGANKNVYVLTSDLSGQTQYLLGLSPETAVGAQAPQVLLDKQIVFASERHALRLSATNSGLMISFNDRHTVQWLSYDSSTTGPVQLADTWFQGDLTPSLDGRVFSAETSTETGCPQQSLPLAKAIGAYDQSGRLWEFSLPSCAVAAQIRPLPDGGVVATVIADDGTAQNRKLIALNANGNLRWQIDLPLTANDETSRSVDFSVGTSGNITFIEQYARSDANLGVRLWIVSGVTGAALNGSSYDFVPTQEAGGYSFAAPSDVTFATVKGIAYVTLNPCGWSDNGGAVNCYGRPTLYAISMPDASLDYPRWGFGDGTTPTPIPSVDAQVLYSPNDKLLTRQIKFTSADPNVRSYDYAWAKAATSVNPGTIQHCKASTATCTLNFAAPDPGHDWNLLIRTVSSSGKVGKWSAKRLQIPQYIYTIIFGDSVSSGHHRDSEGVPTTCDDAQYSYGYTVWLKRQAQLPAKWQKASLYMNFAHSGFSTYQVIHGGKNACGQQRDGALDQIVFLLQHNQNSWNFVAGTAGVNDTNWGDVLTAIVNASSNGTIKSQSQCAEYIGKWNYLDPNGGVVESLTQNARAIAIAFRQADPSAHLIWLGYYNVSGTGSDIVASFTVPQICKKPFDVSLTQFYATLHAAVEGNMLFVDIGTVLSGRDDLLQDLFPSDTIWHRSGWPHPNRQGHLKVGMYVVQQ